MIFGFKNVNVEVVFLANDDETTPIKMIGKKMLPILETNEGSYIAESLDIVNFVDEIDGKTSLTRPLSDGISVWIDSASSVIFKLAIPRWALSEYPEFAKESARNYFVSKKESIFGSFTTLLKDSEVYLSEVNEKLLELDTILSVYQYSESMWSMSDIQLFPLIRALSVVKGIKWPANVDMWREKISEQSHVALEDDVAL
jgi:glutaredoxin 2